MLSVTNGGNANQTTVRYYLTPVRMVSSKRQEIASVRKEMKKSEPLCTLGGDLN